MSDSGLSTRLRQQSRRAGLMVGFTMVLAIVILIFGAAGLFAWLSRPFSDLIPMVAPAAQVRSTEPQTDSAIADAAPTAPVIATEAAPDDTTPPPTAPPEETEFEATHQISANQSVNIRTGPSTNDSVIVALSPGTPLQYLDEDQPASESADGNRWMRFRTEAGQEGWVVELLTVPFQP